MKFNGLALLPLLLLFLPVARHIAVQVAQEIALLIEESRLRIQLRRLDPLHPTVPEIVARITTIERTFP